MSAYAQPTSSKCSFLRNVAAYKHTKHKVITSYLTLCDLRRKGFRSSRPPETGIQIKILTVLHTFFLLRENCTNTFLKKLKSAIALLNISSRTNNEPQSRSDILVLIYRHLFPLFKMPLYSFLDALTT